MRYLGTLLAALASLVIVAAPALGASTFQIREQGAGLAAYFTNVDWSKEEGPAPGDYAETSVDAATSLATGGGDYQTTYVCVRHFAFSIDEFGDWIDGGSFEACGPADTLAIDARLTTGHVTASLPVESCLAWDEETGECLEPVDLGLLEIDLTLTGDGPVLRSHDVGSDGSAGVGQYAFHGTSTTRSATPSGNLVLDGGSLVDTATFTDGMLFQARSGWVEVSH